MYGDWTCGRCLIVTPPHLYREKGVYQHSALCPERQWMTPAQLEGQIMKPLVTPVTDESLITNKSTPESNTMAQEKTLTELGKEITEALSQLREQMQQITESPEWKKAVADIHRLAEAVKTNTPETTEPGPVPEPLSPNRRPGGAKRVPHPDTFRDRLDIFAKVTAGWRASGEELLGYYMQTVMLQPGWDWAKDADELIGWDRLPGMELRDWAAVTNLGTVLIDRTGVYIVTGLYGRARDYQRRELKNPLAVGKQKLRFDVVGV